MSEVPASGLLALDGLEQCLEVALAEAEGSVPFDEFEEDGGPVAQRFGEDLQQVAVLVPVDQDAPLLQFLNRHPDVPDPFPQRGIVVVGVRCVQELDPLRAESVDSAEDVVGGERQMLAAGLGMELQVLVDLRLALAGSFSGNLTR